MVDTKQVNLRLDEDTLAKIDEIRDDVPRNTWIVRAVELRLMAGNLTNDEIDRLLADWQGASALRQVDGTYDDVDRGIELKRPKGAEDGS